MQTACIQMLQLMRTVSQGARAVMTFLEKIMFNTQTALQEGDLMPTRPAFEA